VKFLTLKKIREKKMSIRSLIFGLPLALNISLLESCNMEASNFIFSTKNADENYEHKETQLQSGDNNSIKHPETIWEAWNVVLMKNYMMM
jgi:hypothetical protein